MSGSKPDPGRNGGVGGSLTLDEFKTDASWPCIEDSYDAFRNDRSCGGLSDGAASC